MSKFEIVNITWGPEWSFDRWYSLPPMDMTLVAGPEKVHLLDGTWCTEWPGRVRLLRPRWERGFKAEGTHIRQEDLNRALEQGTNITPTTISKLGYCFPCSPSAVHMSPIPFHPTSFRPPKWCKHCWDENLPAGHQQGSFWLIAIHSIGYHRNSLYGAKAYGGSYKVAARVDFHRGHPRHVINAIRRWNP
jgi:hypothetical protein